MWWSGWVVGVTYLALMTETKGESRQFHVDPLSASKLPWYEAYITCLDRSHSLYVPREDDFSDMKDYLPENGSLMWIGGRYVHTDWRWADGCGVLSSVGCSPNHSLTPSVRVLTSDHPFDCLTRCGTKFVALQKSTCTCLTSLPEVLPEEACNYRCAGNFDRSCGGLHTASIYTSFNSNTFPWDNGSSALDEDCAHLHVPISSSPSLKDVRIRTDPCGSTATEFKMSLCQKCDPDKGNCNVTRNGQYMTWLKADTACWQKGEELFSGGYNMTLPLILESFKPANYWIGLRRHFVLKWINGSDVAGPDIRIRGGFCLAAYKSSDNLITVIAVDCSIPLSFACEINKNSAASFFTASQHKQSADNESCHQPAFTSTSLPDVTTVKTADVTSENTHKPDDVSPTKKGAASLASTTESMVTTGKKDATSKPSSTVPVSEHTRVSGATSPPQQTTESMTSKVNSTHTRFTKVPDEVSTTLNPTESGVSKTQTEGHTGRSSTPTNLPQTEKSSTTPAPNSPEGASTTSQWRTTDISITDTNVIQPSSMTPPQNVSHRHTHTNFTHPTSDVDKPADGVSPTTQGPSTAGRQANSGLTTTTKSSTPPDVPRANSTNPRPSASPPVAGVSLTSHGPSTDRSANSGLTTTANSATHGRLSSGETSRRPSLSVVSRTSQGPSVDTPANSSITTTAKSATAYRPSTGASSTPRQPSSVSPPAAGVSQEPSTNLPASSGVTTTTKSASSDRHPSGETSPTPGQSSSVTTSATGASPASQEPPTSHPTNSGLTTTKVSATPDGPWTGITSPTPGQPSSASPPETHKSSPEIGASGTTTHPTFTSSHTSASVHGTSSGITVTQTDGPSSTSAPNPGGSASPTAPQQQSSTSHPVSSSAQSYPDQASPKPTPSSEPKLTPSSEPKLTPSSEPKPTPSSEPKPTPSSEPKPTPSSEPKPTPSSEPKSTSQSSLSHILTVSPSSGSKGSTTASPLSPDNFSNQAALAFTTTKQPNGNGVTSSGNTDPSGGHTETQPPTRVEEPADDLTPLYILLGILGGMLVITAIIVLTIFKYRSGRFARRRVYEDTLRRHSEDRLTVHNQDDEFISVDNSAYRPSS